MKSTTMTYILNEFIDDHHMQWVTYGMAEMYISKHRDYMFSCLVANKTLTAEDLMDAMLEPIQDDYSHTVEVFSDVSEDSNGSSYAFMKLQTNYVHYLCKLYYDIREHDTKIDIILSYAFHQE